jgi:proline dehydrogenase
MRPYVRLVKGAYRESATVALQSRPEIDARYREMANELLGAGRQGARVVFGTHDLDLVTRIRQDARALGVAESTFEVQMLYGIQDAGRRKLSADGIRTRVLISYGKAWYPWFMRRLAEKPSNLLLVGRNLLS